MICGLCDDDGWHGNDGDDGDDDLGHSQFSTGIAPDRTFCADRFCCRETALGSKMPFLITDRENALEILQKRYAKGEISKDEYERIKADIQ